MVTDAAKKHGDAGFDLTAFFAGATRGWGIFEDRFGKLRRRFTVEMHGRWQGGVFVLDERFRYETGEEESRVWRLTPQVHGRFSATSDDCVGTLAGVATPDSVTMRYRFILKLESRPITVDFDDRIYRMGDTIAVNRATMSKWGIKLGEVSLFFESIGKDVPAAMGIAAE